MILFKCERDDKISEGVFHLKVNNSARITRQPFNTFRFSSVHSKLSETYIIKVLNIHIPVITSRFITDGQQLEIKFQRNDVYQKTEAVGVNPHIRGV